MKKKILFMMAFALGIQFVSAQAIDGTKILMHFPFDDNLTAATGPVSLSPKTAAVVNNYTIGKIGRAALFSDTPYITSGSTFSSGESFTISFWIKINDLNSAAGTPKIIHQEEDPNPTTLAGRPIQLSGAPRKLNTVFGEIATNSTNTPETLEWIHVAYVMDKTAETIKLYLNGVENQSNTIGDNIKVNNRTNEAELSFGVQKGSDTIGLLDAYLDDFLITTEVLTPNQIKSVMNLGVTESQTSDTNIWLGTTSVFETDANWSQGTAPVLAENVVIPNGTTNNPTATTAISLKNLVIQKNASLNVGNNAITATSTTVNGGGSLIAKNTVSGTFTYNVLTTIDNSAPPQIANPEGAGNIFNPAVWNLLSSPVVGETYNNDWIADYEIGTGTAANRAIALYDNTTDADGNWDYYLSTSGTSPTFESGIGFSTRKKTADYQNNNEEVYTFIGTFPDANVTLSITQGTPTGNNWNLMGNPFPSYIRVSGLMAAANGGGTNADNITDANETVYVWNGTTYTGLATTDYIQPGQGFFISADNSTTNNFSIPESIQSHQTGVTFYKNADAKITLSISEGDRIRNAFISYSDDKTLGLDPGNDIGMFTGVGSSFAVYTHLVGNDTGIAFEKQALPNSDFESMIVPVGVIASAGKEISFSIDAQNLPSGINVYLEDKVANTFTLLENGTNHKVTLATKQEGIGRFYLHTRSAALNTDDVLLDAIRIFKTNNATVRISGLNNGKANFKMFTILGKQLLNTSFTANGNKDISLPNLATGIYLIQLETEQGNISKKIILE